MKEIALNFHESKKRFNGRKLVKHFKVPSVYKTGTYIRTVS